MSAIEAVSVETLITCLKDQRLKPDTLCIFTSNKITFYAKENLAHVADFFPGPEKFVWVDTISLTDLREDVKK